MTNNDLKQFRGVIKEELKSLEERLESVEDKVDALSGDVEQLHMDVRDIVSGPVVELLKD